MVKQVLAPIIKYSVADSINREIGFFRYNYPRLYKKVKFTMKQDTERFKRRLNLLQAHVQEIKQYKAIEKADAYSLKCIHQREQENLDFYEQINMIKWTRLIVRQAKEIIKLTKIRSLQRITLFARQRQEEQELNQQIEYEKKLKADKNSQMSDSL